MSSAQRGGQLLSDLLSLLQLTHRLVYPVVFVMPEQSSLLQIDGIPVSWVYSRNGEPRRGYAEKLVRVK